MRRLMILFVLTVFISPNGRANEEGENKNDLARLNEVLEIKINLFKDAGTLIKDVYDFIRPDWAEVTINETMDLVRTYWEKMDDRFGRFKASHMLEALFCRENKNKFIVRIRIRAPKAGSPGMKQT